MLKHPKLSILQWKFQTQNQLRTVNTQFYSVEMCFGKTRRLRQAQNAGANLALTERFQNTPGRRLSIAVAVLKNKDEEEGKDKEAEDKPVVNPLEDKEPVLNPPEPVPVRLDSQPLESASSQEDDKTETSQGSTEGQEEKADETKVIHCTLYFAVKYDLQKMCRLTIVNHILALLVSGAFAFCSWFVL